MIDYFQRKLAFEDREMQLLLSTECGGQLSDQQKKILFNNQVEIINLELSKFCNRKCDYCPVNISDRQTSQSLMPEALLQQVVMQLASIKYSKTVSLNLYNEPLENPNFIAQVTYIRDHLPLASLIFNSNGDRLRASLLRALANSGIRKIVVTLHPQPNKNITFAEIQRRTSVLLKKIAYPETLNLTEDLPYVEFFHQGVQLKIQWPNWRLAGGSRGGTLEHMDTNKRVRTAPCNRPFREFTIYFDGTVTPCCEVFHDGTQATKAVVGQITPSAENTLFDLYCSQYLAKFRQSVFGYAAKTGVCQYCHFKDTSDGSDMELRQRLLDSLQDTQTCIPLKMIS